MVGRMVDNRLAVQATGTSPTWASLLEQVNVAAGFDLALQPDPYQPTDVANFNQAGVPSLSFTTGAHADYHKPSDTADKINYEDLERVGAHGLGDRRPRDGHGRSRRRSPRSSSRSRPRTAPVCASSPAPCPTTPRPPRGCC